MLTGQLQIEIEEKPEIVFDLLADLAKCSAWNPSITEASFFIEKPIRKGAKGRFVGKSGRRRMEYEVIYHEYDRLKSFSCSATANNEISKMSYEFVPTKEGTKINFRFEFQPKGPLRLLEPFIKLFKRLIIKQEQKELEALKAYITKSR